MDSEEQQGSTKEGEAELETEAEAQGLEPDSSEMNSETAAEEAEEGEDRLAALKRARQNLADVTQKLDSQRAELAAAGIPADGAGESAEERREVSASTIARMMGLVTAREFRLLEGKLDLMLTRFASLQTKLDGIGSRFQMLPTGHDLERIDVQIGSLRTLVKETIENAASASSAAEKSKRLRAGIVSNAPSSEEVSNTPSTDDTTDEAEE